MAEAIRKVVQFWSRCLLGEPWPQGVPGGGVRSDFLFVQPSALHGMARTLDLGATYDVYNMSASPAQADVNALFADMVVVGQDLKIVMNDWTQDDEAKQIPLPIAVEESHSRLRVESK